MVTYGKAAKCPQCGSVLRRTGSLGLCVRCLMETVVRSASKGSTPSPNATVRCLGEYELLECIGEGGQGIVYRARQRSLDRIVALKVLRGGGLAADSDVARFRAEAAAAAALHHPGIVGVYEVGECDGQPYYSMELVEGADLGRVALEEVISPDWAARCVARLAEAVQAAHERGVLHRDLKPSNILLDADEAPHITDFGLARRLDAVDHFTRSGQALGTPGYVPPELARGRHQAANAAVDVYGLGAILYFLLARRAPFVGDSVADVLRQVVEREPIPLRTLHPGVPRDLETICLKCLRKEPAQRYSTARALSEELGRFLRHEPIQARPVSPLERAWRFCRRRPWVAALSLGLAGCLIALAVGSTVAAVLLNAARSEERRQHELAHRSEGRAFQALSEAYLAQARALRLSGRPGQRFGALDAVEKATRIEGLSPQLKLAVRNEAIAAMALVDLRLVRTRQFSLFEEWACFDRTLERYALRGTNGVITVRGAADDRELSQFAEPADARPWRPSQFSPDGRFLLLGSGSTSVFRVCDLTTGRLAFGATGDWATFAPHEHQLAWRDPAGGVILYDLATSTQVKFAAASLCHKPTFDPDGKKLAFIVSQALDQIRVLDSKSGAELIALRLPGETFEFAWHPDGRHLATSCAEPKGTIQIWDTTLGTVVKTLSGHLNHVIGLAFNEEGSLLASSAWDGTTRLWSFPAGRELLRLSGEGHPRFGSAGRRLGLTHWEQDALSIFDLAPPSREARRIEIQQEPKEGGESIAFNTGGSLLAHTGGGGQLTLRDPMTIRPLVTLTNPAFGLVRQDPNSDGFLVKGGATLFRLPVTVAPDNGELQIGTLTQVGPTPAFSAFGVSHDGRSLGSVAVDWQVGLFDFETGALRTNLGRHNWARYLAVSPDGRWVATSAWNQKNVKVWDGLNGHFERELLTESMANVVFSPDGDWLVTGSQDFVFWRVSTWEAAKRIPRQPLERFPSPMVFTRDGSVLALCPTLRSVRLVAPSTGEEFATLELPDPWRVCGLCFSPDGSQLAMSGELTREFCVWDLRLVREHLATLKLDWDLPPYANAAQHATLRVK